MDLPDPGIEPGQYTGLQEDSLPAEPSGKPQGPPEVAMILVFLMISFKPAFSLSSFTLIKRLFSSSSLFTKIPWTEEPGGLQSMGSQRVRHD